MSRVSPTLGITPWTQSFGGDDSPSPVPIDPLLRGGFTDGGFYYEKNRVFGVDWRPGPESDPLPPVETGLF